MATLEQLLADLDALKAVRRSGELRIKHVGVKGSEDEVVYRSDAELAAAIAALETEIAALQGTPAVRSINVRSKGWA